MTVIAAVAMPLVTGGVELLVCVQPPRLALETVMTSLGCVVACTTVPDLVSAGLNVSVTGDAAVPYEQVIEPGAAVGLRCRIGDRRSVDAANGTMAAAAVMISLLQPSSRLSP